MDEAKVQQLLEELFIYVAAQPWKDTTFVRSEVAQRASKDHVISHIKAEILNLHKEAKNA